MPVTINADDNEFAAAHGTNIDSHNGTNTFDNPPNTTYNLTITSNAGDSDPYMFDVGETYDLAWQGHDGGLMDDAVIVRSDYLGPGQGVIVFEGTNNGETYQIVWTPNFNLDQWYYDNGGETNPPSFYTTDQAAADYQYVCFARGTMIATPGGARPVESLRPGHMVSTLDNGPRPIVWMGRKTVLGVGAAAPVVIQPGVLGNDRRLVLSQQHRLLVASPLAELYFAAPEVWVPAKALLRPGEITLVPQRLVSYYHILLADHEILTAENTPCESLYLGDVASETIGAAAQAEIAWLAPRPATGSDAMQADRLMLRYQEARFLAMEMQNAAAASAPRHQYVA